MTTPKINSVLSESLIRYSQVWEDNLVLCTGLDIQENDNVLSIASAGCNALSLLLAGAKQVVAVDLNPAQIALVHLKKQAITHCTHEEYRTLMGVDQAEDPIHRYRSIREHLDLTTKEFWDANEELLKVGIIHVGKLDRYFKVFQQQFIQKMVPKEELEKYLHSACLEEQSLFFERYFSHPKFIEAFKHYTSTEMVASSGRDPAQFAFVTQKDTGTYFYDRFRFVCTQIPARTNFYLHYLLSGSYKFIAPPQYRSTEFTLLKNRIHRLEIRHEGIVDTINHFPNGYFSKANLSDLFEYLSPKDTQSLIQTLIEGMSTKSRLAYWNLLVDRSASSTLPITEYKEKATALHKKDRCFFYSRFIIEEAS
jgi:S-adenosylmethionine-diacylglycerol 3-amino-3-carboxypropyl transferase